jgi:hypothetical protein
MKHWSKLAGPAPFSQTEWALLRKSWGGCHIAEAPILPSEAAGIVACELAEPA